MAQLTEQQIEAQIDRAIANQAAIDAVEPRANKVSFDDGRIFLYFDSGVIFSFLPESVTAISQMSSEMLATVELTPSGKGLRWTKPDIDLSIQGLLLGIFDRSLEIEPTADKKRKSTAIT